MSETTISAEEAHNLILSGSAPDGLTVSGHLDFSGNVDLVRLPDALTVTRLTLNGCKNVRSLPARLSCYELEMQQTAIQDIPADLQVEYRLDLWDSRELRSLPDGFKTGSLILRDCIGLKSLPEGLDVYFLDISGCRSLTGWPHTGAIRFGRLSARQCAWMRALPDWITNLAQLDVSGCINLSELPEGLTISSWLDLTGAPITSLPTSLQKVRLRWRDVLVTQWIVFHPESITVQEVLGESNAEVRRVMLECMGYEAFMTRAEAQLLDQDRDPGGERRLLRVAIGGDEPLVCIAVTCPSTDRRYVIRVPPAVQTCHQAAAWIAGYDDPGDYRPLAET